MSSSSIAVVVHENWILFLVIITHAAVFFLLIPFYQTIKEACLNLYQDPTQIFKRRSSYHHQADTVLHEFSI